MTFLLWAALALADDTIGSAALLSATGKGEATLPGGSAQPLSVGMPLPAGALVCTGADGYATIRLALAAEGHHHDDVSLLPGTCLVVEALSADEAGRSSQISVTRGSITVQDAGGQGPGTVRVRTRDGVATGTSGGFRVHIEDSATRTEALYHPVSVSGAGESVALDAGEGNRVREGQAPEAPVPLLVPGRPTLPEDHATLRTPTFAWTPVDRALGYRVEISASPVFDQVVLAEESARPTWTPEMLLLPFRVPGLWWRVAAIDRTGFIGLPSDARQLGFPPGVGP